jgi:hypothetical protein
MEIFLFYQMRKKQGNKKRERVVYTREGVPILVCSPEEVREHPCGSCP